MRTLLSAAGRAFLRAFAAALIVYSFGVLAAPNLNRAYDVGVAALAASLGAGLRAIQAYVPQLSLAHYLGQPFGDWADAFLHGFLGAFVISITGWLGTPDLSGWRSVGVGAVVGAFAAGMHALQDVTTHGEQPAPATGVAEPPKP